MKTIYKTALASSLLLMSSQALAQPYNHGNHNDPQILFGTSSIDTLNCGSSSLSACISAVNLENISKQWCRNMVVDVTDGPLPYGQSYYHTVQSYALHIISATDNGSLTNNYSIDLLYSCSGLNHPGIVERRQ